MHAGCVLRRGSIRSMSHTESTVVVVRCASLTTGRRIAWEAIARVWGCTAAFVVDHSLAGIFEQVDFPGDCWALQVRLSAAAYCVKHDAKALRLLVEDACRATRSADGRWQLQGDPIGMLSSLIELDEEPATALRDQYGLIEGCNSWRDADALLVPVLELIAAAIEKCARVPFRCAPFPGGKSWAVAFSSDLDVLEDDHLGRVLDILAKRAVDRPSFMVCAVEGSERTIRDVHYDIKDVNILRITEPLRNAGVEIGLHGSYLAHDRVDWLARQKQRLEDVFEQKVRSHRSHFLRFAKPRSWLAQRQAGFDYDASLGYADLPGFRNGCASPIEYLLANDQKLCVFSTPFIDQHFFWPAIVSDDAFHATVDPLLAELSRIGGVMTLDWHSYTIRGEIGNGWWDRLEYILSQANLAGAYIGGIGSVGDAYFHKRSDANDRVPLVDSAVQPAIEVPGTASHTGKRGHRSAGPQRAAASQSYFDTSGVWADRPAFYQVQLRETLKALLGNDPISVLDVGCGNGLITNDLPLHVSVTAVDLSQTALRHVRVPKRQGSITSLPFSDQSFDFVYCFDVIEHLSDEDMRTGLEELQRVARRHVLVAVPLNEDLNANSVRCAECGLLYHINGHLRAHDIEWLGRMPVTHTYERSAIFLSGDITVPPVNPLLKLYWSSGIYPERSVMKCPQCGSDSVMSASQGESLRDVRQIADSFRSAEWANRLRRGAGWCDRSEGLVLLTRKGIAAKLPVTTGGTKPGPPLEVDFGNRLQAVVGDFTPGALWARFKLGRGIALDGGGLSQLNVECNDSYPTTLNFPVVPRPGDHMVLEVSCLGDAAISCFGIDGVSGAIVQLLDAFALRDVDHLQHTVTVESTWAPGRFGLAVDIYLYGTARLHRVRYVPQRAPPDVDVATVQPGFNVVQVPGPAGVGTYWTYHSLARGKLPLTGYGEVEQDQNAESVARLFESVWEQVQFDKQLLLGQEKNKTRIAELVDEPAQMRKTLAQTQETLTQTQATLANVQLRLDRTWEVRVRRLVGRGLAYAKAKLRVTRSVVGRLLFAHGRLNVGLALDLPPRWKPVEPSVEHVPGRGPRVLILSHMFPHPEQPGSGSFVLEQAQALLRAGVEVRVVSCRPFWMTSHRSPFRLLGALYNYAKLYAGSSRRWWLVEGVLVRFLPYPILGPFWSHAWAYGAAIARNARYLQAEFEPDLIHAHTAYLDGTAALVLSSRLKRLYVITEHTGPFSVLTANAIIRRATLKALAKAARVVAVSEALRKDIACYQDLGPAVMTVIPNVVDVEQFRLATGWHPQSSEPRILFVGYFAPVKNIPLLLDAFKKVRAVRPAAKLMLVGGGEVPSQQQELIDMIAQLGLASAVTVRGYAERREVARLMREECDMLVLASRSETFGCVVAEALASGKPAVITPCGGPQDIVTERWMGEVCAINGDAEALATAILAVADRLRSFEPRRIRESAVERFSARSVAGRLSQLYKDVLAEQSATAHSDS